MDVKYRIELDSTQRCMRVTQSGPNSIEAVRDLQQQLTNQLARYRVRSMIIDVSQVIGPTLEGTGVADLMRNEPFYLRSLTRVFVGPEFRLRSLRSKFNAYSGGAATVHTATSLDEAYRLIGFLPVGFKLVDEWLEPEPLSVAPASVVEGRGQFFEPPPGEDFSEVLDQLVVKQSVGGKSFFAVEQPR
jgi:hypothetical protein